MIRYFLMGIASFGAMAAIACSSSNNSSSGNNNNADSGTTNTTGSVCVVPKTSSNDGTTPCTDDTCMANQHCGKGGIICNAGCTSTANCASGQYCDLSAGSVDIDQTPSGTCRVPTPCPSTTTSTVTASGSGTALGCFTGAGQATVACNTANKCFTTSCDAQLKVALGNNYAQDTVGGACAEYYSCVAAAGCTDAAEQSCMGKVTADCSSALQAVSSCVQSSCSSQETACEMSLTAIVDNFDAGGGTNTGDDSGDVNTTPDAAVTGDCATLAACCTSITDANAKMDCVTESQTGNQPLCQNAESTFCTDGN